MSITQLLLSYLDVPTVLIFLIILLFLVAQRKPHRYPPGPLRWPVIGNLPIVIGAKMQAKDFMKISQKHGSVFSLRLGVLDMVIINGYDAIHEAFSEKAELFTGRPHDLIYIIQKGIGKKGLIMNEGPSWHELRKMIAVAFRDFGVGKKTLEERILDECQALFEVLDSKQKAQSIQSTNLQRTLMSAVSNIICSITFGDRFQYTDKQFVKLLDSLARFFRTSALALPENAFPFLRFIRTSSQTEDMIGIQNDLRDFVRQQVEKHKETFDPDNIRDIVDLYLQVTGKEKRQTKAFSNESMVRAIVDLFSAGTETTSLSTTWAILFLVCYPEIQRELHKEIMQVIDNGRRPSLQDKPHLPYVQAFISEMMRVVNIAPTSVPHVTQDEVELCGYVIPKRTVCTANIYSVHMDPKEWPEPEEFRPERWINKNGEFYKPSKAFLPFSLGPRACLGEQLARIEFFLFLTSMVQQYEFSTPIGAQLPRPFPERSGITTTPPDYELYIMKRE
ncbi:cytochrome P450 2J2-like [Lingula anatina]|uniref:Steroid 21-hydroxylase n=1 Tax=Lingula anatina TaxID=7574 RepID=A0A1S3IK71_LINAN|nr:cytochrome P450 2J2-like [Lingula anatina]|eukprot:XP_013398640.1 cytochrome P450 2J2-like [Lingula anatina]